MAVASPQARADVARQRLYDDDRRDRRGGVLEARMRGALEARDAMHAGHEGAAFAYRQALIDLASWCGVLADELDPPADAPRRRWRR